MARKPKVKSSSHKKKHSGHVKDSEKSKKSDKTSFFGKIGLFFSEAVKAPPEETKSINVSNEEEVVDDASAEYELAAQDAVQKMVLEETDEDDEPEEPKDDRNDEILSLLNEATEKWKVSGDTGLHLEPPKSWSERMKIVWSSVNVQSSRLSGRLKILMKEVSERVAARQKQAKKEGAKINSDDIVREEWKDVLNKLEKVSTPSEREEIEKIYKQLENV